MAGRRQHVIPRFLLEGFASRTTGHAAFTWVYRKETPPFESNITNVGVEGLFYTGGDDGDVDGIITAAESEFSNLVRALRTGVPAAPSNPELPRLIAHLEVRTRHLRQNFLQAGDFLVSRFLDFMAEERAFAHFLERKLQNDPSILHKPFLEELTRRGLPQALLKPLIQASSALLPALIEQLKPELPKFAEMLRSSLPTKLADAAKSGHVRALALGVAPEVRTERYSNLSYSVLEVPDDHLVLGDSAVLFQLEGPRPYKAFLDRGDALNAVFLPLTPKTVLVGTHECLTTLPRDLRRAVARCSLEYFIAAENSDANSLLKDQIGEDASPLTREELEEIISEVMKE